MKDSARTFTAGCTQLIGDDDDNEDDNGENDDDDNDNGDDNDDDDDDNDGDNDDAKKSRMFTAGLQPGDRKLSVSNPCIRQRPHL